MEQKLKELVIYYALSFNLITIKQINLYKSLICSAFIMNSIDIPNTINPAKKYKIIIAATGSVAAIKLLELVKSLIGWADIKVVMTSNAKKFISSQELELIKTQSGLQVLFDQQQWLSWTKRGDPVLHIELRKWADALVIAPLSANTLAKISNGICDNLITLICRCWSIGFRKNQLLQGQNSTKENKLINPIIVCPAMNTMMWEHPITTVQINKLKQWGYTIVDPVQKVLVCGDQGKGAMAAIEQIINCLKEELQLRSQYLQIKNKEI